MAVDATNSTLITTTNTAEFGLNGARRTPKQNLGKDDFLMLLTQQLKNQDPLKPMENTEFVSQMANFSSLEQMTNMNRTMESFVSSAAGNFKTQAMTMLGLPVTAMPSGATEPISGTVESVRFVNGAAVFRVGGKDVSMADITAIHLPGYDSTTATPAGTGSGAGTSTGV